MKMIYALSAVALLSSSAHAACTLDQFAGTWSRPIPSQSGLENAGSSEQETWILKGNALTMQVDGFDSYSDTSGPYYQYQVLAQVTLDPKTCVLTANETKSISTNFRNFEDPTPDTSSDESAVNKTEYYRLDSSNGGLVVSKCVGSECVQTQSPSRFTKQK